MRIPVAIYYTETYDENMMSVFVIRVGLCCPVVPFRINGEEDKESYAHPRE